MSSKNDAPPLRVWFLTMLLLMAIGGVLALLLLSLTDPLALLVLLAPVGSDTILAALAT